MNFQKLTPNLFVRDVDAAIRYYCDVLGFTQGMTVPDKPPYIFGSVVRDSIEIFFNDQKSVLADHPEIANRPIGGALTLFIEIDQGIEGLLKKVQQHGATINMPLTEQFYGMKEFGMIDPEGWMLTFAERMK